MIAEYVLKAVAVVVILGGLLPLVLLLLFSRVGIVLLFVAALGSVTAVGAGATLLALDFLYPRSVTVSGFTGLLWLVVPASLASVLLFDMVLEELVLRALQQRGLGMGGIRLVEAFLGGLATALALMVTARLVSGTEILTAAALVAGLISAFLTYFVGTWLRDIDFGDDPELLEEADRT